MQPEIYEIQGSKTINTFFLTMKNFLYTILQFFLVDGSV